MDYRVKTKSTLVDLSNMAIRDITTKKRNGSIKSFKLFHLNNEEEKVGKTFLEKYI